MNLINTSLIASLTRPRPLQSKGLRSIKEERLMHAGYRDLERQPRIRRHWTNR